MKKTCVVKKRLWHYKLINDYSPFWPVKSLCGYVWQVVGCSATVIVGVPFTLSAIVMTPLLIIFDETVRAWIDSLPFIVEIWLLAAAVFGGMAWIVGLSMLLIFTLAATGEFVVVPAIQKLSHVYYKNSDREPGLFRQWLKAKHDKLCPIIKFEDDDE